MNIILQTYLVQPPTTCPPSASTAMSRMSLGSSQSEGAFTTPSLHLQSIVSTEAPELDDLQLLWDIIYKLKLAKFCDKTPSSSSSSCGGDGVYAGSESTSSGYIRISKLGRNQVSGIGNRLIMALIQNGLSETDKDKRCVRPCVS